MSSRRQNENIIQGRRGVTHTLSSSNKIKSSKENVLSTTKPISTSKSNINTTTGKAVNNNQSLSTTKKDSQSTQGKDNLKSIRKPLGLKPGTTSTSTPRTALSSKSSTTQINQNQNQNQRPQVLKPKIASTPANKTKLAGSTRTPLQAKNYKSKSTLNVYTPKPSVKSKLRIKHDIEHDDGVDEVEYMPPPLRENEYQSHLDTHPTNQDDDFFKPIPKPELDINIPFEADPLLDSDTRGTHEDLSFNLDLPNEVIQDDFLLEV
ncbi:uncharacterized protein L201_007317 [Kwoniella dendrophila CBS 6074]|uniref:Securin n=1 Tax=Kwoniella dendrophila CBS 6074 TaxID=1295534 RepID=A0AAX4K6C8_9TREE